MILTIKNMVSRDHLEVSPCNEVYVKKGQEDVTKMFPWDSLTEKERREICKVSEEFTRLLVYYKVRSKRT